MTIDNVKKWGAACAAKVEETPRVKPKSSDSCHFRRPNMNGHGVTTVTTAAAPVQATATASGAAAASVSSFSDSKKSTK